LLYNVETHTINYHLKKIFADGELDENSVIRKFRITASDGKSYNTNHYNLKAIIAVGNKVDSPRAVQFRKWANGTTTGDHAQAIADLVKGFKGGNQCETFLGVTGSGKTFTMANIIQQRKKPTLSIAHIKTLAAQRFGEFE